MIRALSISGQDIVYWAERYTAAATLPILVRRLLLATNSAANVEMRGDSGTRLGGADGIVEARHGQGLCPPGLSMWELSVERDVKGKLDDDFDKRTANPDLPIDARKVSYVAVTARRYAKKQAWAKEKMALGRWADVRVYDADDLATYLEQAPAVATWFSSSELGRPSSDIRTIDDFLYELTHASDPPLPTSIVLTGQARVHAANELLQLLVNTDDELRRSSARKASPLRVWRVGAESVDEALFFVAAALSMPNDQAASLRERTVIVESREAFETCRHLQKLEPLLILPRFKHVLPERVTAYQMQAVLAVSSKDEIPLGEGSSLDVIPYGPLEEALKAAHFDNAGRLARDAHGRISKLRLLLPLATARQKGPTDWSGERAGLLLVGAWRPTQEADRGIMVRMGVDPEKAERLCALMAQGDEPWMEAEEDYHGAKIFRWVSPRAAWKTYGREVTETDLNRFFDVAREVLAPMSEPPTDKRERIRAIFERKYSGCSDAMRAGISTSIAWLAIADDNRDLEPTHRRGRGNDLATALVRTLLTPPWYVWWSLSAIVRDLAEAAPQQFLDQISASIEYGAKGIATLFSNSTEGMGPDGSFSHAGRGGVVELLWALEALAWNPQFVPQVALLLAQLDVHDKLPENGSNRPFQSLLLILHPLMPQSNTTVTQRIAAIKLLFEHHEQVAWKLCTRLLSALSGGSMIMQTPRPQYRPWVDTNAKTTVTYDDIDKQLQETITLLLEHAGVDPLRWGSLVELPHTSIGWRVLDALKEAYPRLVEKDVDAVLRDVIGRELGLAADSMGRGSDEVNEELVARFTPWHDRLKALYESYEPADLVLRYGWLFDSGDWLPDPVPGGFEANEQERERRQRAAIEEIGRTPDRWKQLERLVARAKTRRPQYLLGHALATSSYVTEVENALLASVPDLHLGECLPLFWAVRLQVEGLQAFESKFRALVERGRGEEAANVALLFGATEPLWDIVDRIGEPMRSNYWKKHDPLWFDRISAEGYERGIANLLEYDRPEAAASAARRGVADDRVRVSTIVRVLDAVRNAEATGRTIRLQFHDVDPLFVALDKHPDIVEEARFIELEVAHAQRLYKLGFPERGGRGARCFFEKVKRSPEFFVDTLRRLRRPKGQSWDSLDEPKDAAALERGRIHHLLFHWSGYPGEGMPTSEAEAYLERWCLDAQTHADDESLERFLEGQIEIILARVGPAADGHWPCLAARRLLETGRIHGLRTSVFNSRGMTERGLGEGKKPLRELAEGYQASADALRDQYPKTAVMLNAMAQERRRELERVEAEKRWEHITEGEDEPPAKPSAAPTVPKSTIRKGICHIRSIHVENLRCFDMLPIENIPFEEQHGQCLMLLGANGTGKTTLLRAIAAALLDEQAAGTGIDSVTGALLLLRDPEKPGRIKIKVGDDEFRIQLVAEEGRLMVREWDSDSGSESARPWVVGYGCFRGSLLGGNADAMAPAGDTATLWGRNTGLWPGLQWMQEMRKKATGGDIQSQHLLMGASHALTRVLHDIDDVAVESDRLVLRGKGIGGEHSALALSDGYLGTMGWVLDMIARWGDRAQRIGKTISADFLQEMEGIALVDDIDLHIHPIWQRTLLKSLQSTFPRMTFVGTTHNPQTILGVRKGEKVYVLRRSYEDPQRVEALAMDAPEGRRADQVLTGGWFGLDSTLDDETLKWMDEHQKLLLAPVRDEAQIARLEEKIRARIHRFVDTAREAYAYGIVTEILREQLPTLTPEGKEEARQTFKEMTKARLAKRRGKNT